MYGIRPCGSGRRSEWKLEKSAGSVRSGSCGHRWGEEHRQVGESPILIMHWIIAHLMGRPPYNGDDFGYKQAATEDIQDRV